MKRARDDEDPAAVALGTKKGAVTIDSTLPALIDSLRGHYGQGLPPPGSDLFELILRENIAYLATAEKRQKAFLMLKESVGTEPADILSATDESLLAVAAFGILRRETVSKLRACARTAIEEFGSDLGEIAKDSVAVAERKLCRFPSIGLPAAGRILLFAELMSELAPDSNGLRVLKRVGLIEEGSGYLATYKKSRELSLGRGKTVREYQEAHSLLEIHGKSLCKRTKPRCAECPVRDSCAYGSKRTAAP